MPPRRNSERKRREDLLNPHLGSRIRLRREQLKMTQTDLGKLIGVSYQQVQKYEAGGRISAAMLGEMSEVLNIDVSYFYHGQSRGADPPQRPAGMAEGQAPFGSGGMDHTQQSELLRAYAQISDPFLRDCILVLLQALPHSRPTPPPRAGRK